MQRRPALSGNAAGNESGGAHHGTGKAEGLSEDAACRPESGHGRKVAVPRQHRRRQAAEPHGTDTQGKPKPEGVDLPHGRAGSLESHGQHRSAQEKPGQRPKSILPGRSGQAVFRVLDHGEVHPKGGNGPEQSGPLRVEGEVGEGFRSVTPALQQRQRQHSHALDESGGNGQSGHVPQQGGRRGGGRQGHAAPKKRWRSGFSIPWRPAALPDVRIPAGAASTGLRVPSEHCRPQVGLLPPDVRQGRE